jgi:hypothetical protein
MISAQGRKVTVRVQEENIGHTQGRKVTGRSYRPYLKEHSVNFAVGYELCGLICVLCWHPMGQESL